MNWPRKSSVWVLSWRCSSRRKRALVSEHRISHHSGGCSRVFASSAIARTQAPLPIRRGDSLFATRWSSRAASSSRMRTTCGWSYPLTVGLARFRFSSGSSAKLSSRIHGAVRAADSTAPWDRSSMRTSFLGAYAAGVIRLQRRTDLARKRRPLIVESEENLILNGHFRIL